TTKDGKSVGFDAIVTWQISSMEKALLGVTELHDALRDTCVGLIGTHLSGVDWEAIRSGAAVEEMTSVCRKSGWGWGEELKAVQLSGISLVKNFRVTGSSQPHVMHLTPNPGFLLSSRSFWPAESLRADEGHCGWSCASCLPLDRR